MKNCDPFVFGPAFAIARAPRSTLWSLNSSSNWYPGPPEPVPVGSPPWIMKSGITRWKIDAVVEAVAGQLGEVLDRLRRVAAVELDLDRAVIRLMVALVIPTPYVCDHPCVRSFVRRATATGARRRGGRFVGCGAPGRTSRRRPADREWVANAAGVIDQLNDRCRRRRARGPDLATARRSLRDLSDLFGLLVAYTDFGGCNKMVGGRRRDAAEVRSRRVGSSSWPAATSGRRRPCSRVQRGRRDPRALFGPRARFGSPRPPSTGRRFGSRPRGRR